MTEKYIKSEYAKELGVDAYRTGFGHALDAFEDLFRSMEKFYFKDVLSLSDLRAYSKKIRPQNKEQIKCQK